MSIKAIVGRDPKTKKTRVQSVLFSKDWQPSAARKWLTSHGFKASSPESGRDYLRFRQEPPGRFEDFRTITLKSNRRRRNPLLTEEFHGRPPIEEIEATVSLAYPTQLSVLGDLREIALTDGTVLEFTDVLLACSEDRRQLYVVGNVEMPADRRYTLIGEAKHVVYATDKPHLDDPSPDTEYIHKFGEEGGERPLIVYDKDARSILIVGGDYVVKREGIVN
jgi:hypothetical protein